MKTLHKYSIWAILAAPAVYIIYSFLSDIISYGEVIHKTGQFSAYLLLASLAVTPLMWAFPKARWPRTLLYHRRAIGVASFGYAALHTTVYLERKWGYGLILKEGLKPELLTGWIAMLIFLLLALTSNNAAVRFLKRGWKRLHLLTYPAAALLIAHWALATWEFIAVGIFAAVIVLLETIRIFKKRVALNAQP